MPTQVDGALMHAMSGNELSRVRTEFRLRPSRAYQLMPTRVEGADIVMQSSGVLVRQVSDNPTYRDLHRTVIEVVT